VPSAWRGACIGSAGSHHAPGSHAFAVAGGRLLNPSGRHAGRGRSDDAHLRSDGAEGARTDQRTHQGGAGGGEGAWCQPGRGQGATGHQQVQTVGPQRSRAVRRPSGRHTGCCWRWTGCEEEGSRRDRGWRGLSPPAACRRRRTARSGRMDGRRLLARTRVTQPSPTLVEHPPGAARLKTQVAASERSGKSAVRCALAVRRVHSKPGAAEPGQRSGTGKLGTTRVTPRWDVLPDLRQETDYAACSATERWSDEHLIPSRGERLFQIARERLIGFALLKRLDVLRCCLAPPRVGRDV
jgi:hypothetical protein